MIDGAAAGHFPQGLVMNSQLIQVVFVMRWCLLAAIRQFLLARALLPFSQRPPTTVIQLGRQHQRRQGFILVLHGWKLVHEVNEVDANNAQCATPNSEREANVESRDVAQPVPSAISDDGSFTTAAKSVVASSTLGAIPCPF